MRANLTPQEKQAMIVMVQELDDKTLAILWKTIRNVIKEAFPNYGHVKP